MINRKFFEKYDLTDEQIEKVWDDYLDDNKDELIEQYFDDSYDLFIEWLEYMIEKNESYREQLEENIEFVKKS